MQRVYEIYTVTGFSIGAIARRLNSEGVATRKQSARWERSVVWAMLRNPAYRGAAASARRASPAACASRDRCGGAVACIEQQRRPRTSARGVDRDPGAGADQRGELRASAGTAPGEQNTVATSHDHAEHRAGLGQLSEVRLCLLAHLDLHLSAQDPLLQMHRLGRLAKTGRSRVRQCPLRAPGSARSNRVDRGHPVARGSDLDPAGTRSAPRRRAFLRSDQTARTKLAQGTDACRQEHRAAAHRLSRRTLVARAVARANAAAAPARTNVARRAASDRRSSR